MGGDHEREAFGGSRRRERARRCEDKGEPPSIIGNRRKNFYINTLTGYLVVHQTPGQGMASLTVHGHGLKSEAGRRSPKYMSITLSSEDAATSVSSPKSEQKSCLCSPTTHEGSFRCRLHRSSSGYWGKKPIPSPKPTPTPVPADNGVIHQSVEAQ